MFLEVLLELLEIGLFRMFISYSYRWKHYTTRSTSMLGVFWGLIFYTVKITNPDFR